MLLKRVYTYKNETIRSWLLVIKHCIPVSGILEIADQLTGYSVNVHNTSQMISAEQPVATMSGKAWVLWSSVLLLYNILHLTWPSLFCSRCLLIRENINATQEYVCHRELYTIKSKHTRTIKIVNFKKGVGSLCNERKREIHWQNEMLQDLIPTLA